MNDLDTQKKILLQFHKLLRNDGTICASYRAPSDSLNKNGSGINVWGVEIDFYDIEMLKQLFIVSGFNLEYVTLRTIENLKTNEKTAFYNLVLKKIV